VRSWWRVDASELAASRLQRHAVRLRGLQRQLNGDFDVRSRHLLPALVLALAGACSRRPDFGALAGDGYVALATGEQKNVDSRTVRLLPDALALDSALALICMRRQTALDALGDSAAGEAGRAIVDRSWQERERLLSSHVIPMRIDAGAHGGFAVDSLRAGKYRVWADATVGGERWTWLEPVEVLGGDTVQVALSNTNADEDPFRCQRRDIIRDAKKPPDQR
jgi:hypothetical protein